MIGEALKKKEEDALHVRKIFVTNTNLMIDWEEETNHLPVI